MALIGAPTTRGHFNNPIFELNMRKAYIDSYGELARAGLYKRIYNVVTTNKKIERDEVVSGYGTYNEDDEGDVPQYDSGQSAWQQTYTALDYRLGAQFTRQAVWDDINGVVAWLKKTGGGLADVAYYTKEVNAMTLFNSLLTSGTAYTAGGSNYSVLSTTHFRVDGGTWSNRPANDMDLSQQTAEFLIGNHWPQNQVNQRGLKLMTGPTRLLVGSGDHMLARRLFLTTRGRPQSADNDINPLADGDMEIIHHPLLTNDGRFLFLGPKDKTGLNYFERMTPTVERWPDGDNGNARFVGWYRCVSGLTHPSGIAGSP